MTTTLDPTPTASATSTPRQAWDISDDAPVPLRRLVAVELRKSLDTRAGRWLAIAVVGLVLVALLVAALAFDAGARNHATTLMIAGGVLGYFLPLLLILLVTSEWSQRTGLTTFALEPHRSRIITAKLGAGLLLAVGVTVLAFLLSTAATALGTTGGTTGGSESVWDLTGTDVLNFVLTSIIGVLIGFALAMLLRNPAAAIVAYFAYTFVLPGVAAALTALVSWFGQIAPWVEFNTAQMPLLEGQTLSGQEWAQVAVSGTIWLVLPFALGLWRLMRAEVK